MKTIIMAKVICVCNHKGGVGKSTTTINLGVGLANRGKRVLLIDVDSQANLSLFAGVDIHNCPKNVYGALMGEYAPEPIKVKENIFIIPAVKALLGADQRLFSEMARETFMKRMLAKIPAESFDYILIDTAPVISNLTINALVASDSVLIPLQTEVLPLQGMYSMMEHIEKIRACLNPALKINGILPTLYTKSKNIHAATLDMLKQSYGDLVYNTIIRDNVTLSEVPASDSIDIYDYAPTSNGAKDYNDFCDEFLKKEELVNV